MYSRAVIVGTALFLGALPFLTNAQTQTDLQNQIADLLARITALQAQLGASGTPTPGPVATPPIPSGGVQCPHVSRVLKRGATGVDVTRLQQFLALDPSVYPEAQVSGYYGALTEAAVKRFQCKNKLVCDGTPESTGYGVTGPRTAALMALQCPNIIGEAGSNVGGFIKVTPVSGNAPLNVTVEATVNTTKACAAASYEVDYGDNTPKTVINIPSNNCSELRQVLSHTYAAPGTYTIVLRSGIQQTSATVVVGGQGGGGPQGTVDSLAVTPQAGAAPLTVTFRATINSSGACNSNTYTLDFGNGQTAPLTPSGCAPSLVSATHIYPSAGTFTARLVRDAGNIVVGSATVTVGGGSGGSGGTNYGSFFSVTPGASGDVFTVQAEFEIPSSCTGYQLNWGDATASASQSHATCSTEIARKEFEHTYANPGSYTVTLKRGPNLEEVHTAGITISN